MQIKFFVDGDHEKAQSEAIKAIDIVEESFCVHVEDVKIEQKGGEKLWLDCEDTFSSENFKEKIAQWQVKPRYEVEIYFARNNKDGQDIIAVS